MKLLVINGPNINMLGIREPDIYGHTSYSDLCGMIEGWAGELGVEVTIEQSNHEGTLIDIIQDAVYNLYGGVVINAGAYTHYSYAIRDALAMLTIPVIEVHITDIEHREAFRQQSVIRDVCTDSVIGQGIDGYRIAMEKIVKTKNS